MLLINFLCWFLMIVDAGIVSKVYGDRLVPVPENCTEVSYCELHGPAIRFPFRLKGQPFQCGYHGFDLSCTTEGRTVLEIPSSSNKPIVETIDYASQEIKVHFQNDCLPKDIFTFNSSSSTFQFVHGPLYTTDYTLFSCPSPLLATGQFEFFTLCPSGLDNPENQTNYYAVNGRYSIDYTTLVSCTKLRDYTSVPYISSRRFMMPLQWSKPSCGRCEEMGKTCRLKRTIGQYNFTDNQTAETECVSEGIL